MKALKISLFIVFQLVYWLLALFGVIPSLALLIGFIVSKIRKNDSALISSIKFYKYYVYVIGTITVLINLIWVLFIKFPSISPFVIGYAIGSNFVLVALFGFYLFILEYLLKRPMLQN
ncbi:hypothetical protein M2R48_16385 [Acinetobacter sp. I-MWF]|uniref:hypothetical protein n=1 Tax=Acinetobacter sp. I-MWF TaxID=2940517 RepID=UPI0021C656D9|nr:hypothetical protein [Acinetobacter sp. I-MWF]MCT9979916.1 hypothetical protein [Acinetobacter sp. I-MWF]